MNKFDFITIGGATEDIVFYTKDGILIKNKKDILRQELLAFEQGAKVLVDKSFTFFGGGASNSAVNLSKLGFRVAILANIGEGNRGNRIINNLKENGVNTSFINIDKKHESGFSLILNNGKDRIIFTYRGSNDKLVLDFKKIKKISTDNFYVSSLPEKCFDILNIIFSLNTRVYWNPGLRELSLGLKRMGKFLKKTEILILNKDEALELVKSDSKFKNKSNKYLNNIKNLLPIVKSYGPNHVLITDGLGGAYFFNNNTNYHQPIIKNKKTLDTTGVGDSFGSTFCSFFLLFKGDYKKALSLAAKNSASVVSVYGAQNGLLELKKILK